MAGGQVPSFPVSNFVPIAYVGPLTAVNVWLLTSGASSVQAANGAMQQVSAGHQSKVVPLNFQWDSVSPATAAYTIILQNNNQGAGYLLDMILMVYINNSQNINDVTVYFPDTGMFVTAKAGTTGYYPVFTNVWVFNVYNGTDGSPAFQGTTQIFACNFAIPAFSTTPVSDTLSVVTIPATFTALNQFVIMFNSGSIPTTIDMMTLGIIILSITSIAAGPCFVEIVLAAPGYQFTFQASALATAAGQVIPLNLQRNWTWDSVPFELDLEANSDFQMQWLAETNVSSVLCMSDCTYIQLTD